MTITEAKGYYSDSPKTVVYIVVNRFQVGKMKELVHGNDRSAYKIGRASCRERV